MQIGVFSESQEDYLEIISALLSDPGIARVKDIADRKGVSMASVTSALKRLANDGLIVYQSWGIVTLTDKGRKLASRVIDRHEFLRNFLISILGVSPKTAEDDACSFEHSMSTETFLRLVELFEFIDNSELDLRRRFGDFRRRNAKSLDKELCDTPTCSLHQRIGRFMHKWGKTTTLSALKPGEKGRVTRIDATSSIRQRLIDMGVLPNVEIMVQRYAPLGDPIEVKIRGYLLSIRKRDADAILLQTQT